jgi:hypothetical protein
MTDFLGLLEEKTAAERGPALIVGRSFGPREMEVRERMHRAQAPNCEGATAILFLEDEGEMTAEDDRQWQALLGWPRAPTPDEVSRWPAETDITLILLTKLIYPGNIYRRN